jgi:hypothetical protein
MPKKNAIYSDPREGCKIASGDWLDMDLFDLCAATFSQIV